MELRKHIAETRITMTKVDGKIKVENNEVPTGEFVWDFYLNPGEARRFGQELVRLADEFDPVTAEDRAAVTNALDRIDQAQRAKVRIVDKNLHVITEEP